MILPLEQQCCTIESAKRLKELNFPQTSLFYWEMIPEILNSKKFNPIITSRPNCDLDSYSAYTCSELGEMLPETIVGKKYAEALTFDKWRNQWLCCYGEIDDNPYYPTLVEAMAKQLIHLSESGLIERKK